MSSNGDRSTAMRDRQLQVLTDRIHGRARATVNGEIDHDSVPLLLDALSQVLHAHVQHLEVDLAGVRFCDCSGLNALLQIRRHAEDSGIAMVLVGASIPVQRLLDLTGTRNLFTLTEPASSSQAGPG